MFLSTPSGPPAKSVKNPLYPLVFIKIPQNPHFLGGGRVELRKPLHVECWEDVHCLGWRAKRCCCSLLHLLCFLFAKQMPFTPSSVRTRNTLHEVAGSELHGSGMTRISIGIEHQRELREPQPHISQLLTLSWFIIFIDFIYFLSIFWISKVYSKNIGKYSKITAKYSNFRGLGAKNDEK